MDSKFSFIIISIIIMVAYTFPSSKTMGFEHYAIGSINDSSVTADLQQLFNGEGNAVFLIQNQSLGISLGDIIRFKNKVILIDGKVWQTLQKEKYLNSITQTPLVKASATATKTAWIENARITPSKTQSKVFKFGSELLKIMEGYFGNSISQEEFIVRFRDNKMVLIAPESLFSNFSYKPVKSKNRKSAPQFISISPQRIIMGTSFSWQPWAIDLENPSKHIKYELVGDLPKGIQWKSKCHTLSGKPSESGTWALSILATNNYKRTDTLNISLDIYENSAPYFTTPLPDTIYIGHPWTYSIGIADLDNAVQDLGLVYQSSSDDLFFNKRTRTLFYKPEEKMNNKKVFIEIGVFDPQKDTAFISKRIHIKKPFNPVRTQALTLNPPWDTLVTHHSYSWPLQKTIQDANRQNTKLIDIIGTDSTVFIDSILTVFPKVDTTLSLSFLFERGDDTLEVHTAIPVKKNGPPKFLSKLGNFIFPENYQKVYTPILVDPDNDSITISIIDFDTSNTIYLWKNKNLTLLNNIPGSYTIEFKATDSFGNSKKQRIYWKVKPIEKNWSSFNLQVHYTKLLQIYSLQYESTMGRIQIFTPDIMRIYNNSDATIKRWPFLSAGVNVMNQNRTRKGEYAYVDIGLTFRLPHKQVIAGGVFLGTETRVIHNNFIHEFSFNALAKQIIFAADTAGVFKDTGDLSWEDQYEQKTGKIEKLEELGNGILSEYGEKSNITVTLKWQSTTPILPSLYIGPSFKYEFALIGLSMKPTIGIVLRNQFHMKYVKLDHSISLNYGGTEHTTSLEYKFLIGLGSWEK